MDTLDPAHYGIYSHNWLLIHALHHAPHDRLISGIGAMIAYFDNTPSPNVATALDMLGQYALSGFYIDTTSDVGEYDDEYAGEGETDDPITEEEIADFIAEMNEYPDGEGFD